jgi:glucokinase
MYLGIDIGGTKTLLARFTKDGGLQETLKFPTPKDYKEFKKELANNVARITTKPWTMAAVAAPGVIDRETGVVSRLGNLTWKNSPLKSDVESLINAPVLIENDAKLAGLAEARLIKPLPKRALYVTISTGIGLALIKDGVIEQEYGDSGGQGLFFEREGKTVTWESFASGSAIVKRFNKRASDIKDPHVWKLISHDIALGLIDEYAAIQADIVIIGGGVGTHFNSFKVPLRAALKKYESNLIKAPKVIGAKNPETAVIYGCYQLMKDEIKRQAKKA